MSAILIPASLVRELPQEALRSALATLGLVLYSGGVSGAALRQGEPTLEARWASDAIHDQRCAEPGCARLPALLLEGAPYCPLHARRRMEFPPAKYTTETNRP
jgi:hypothetical protein